MLRKTHRRQRETPGVLPASMRPQRNAAENAIAQAMIEEMEKLQ